MNIATIKYLLPFALALLAALPSLACGAFERYYYEDDGAWESLFRYHFYQDDDSYTDVQKKENIRLWKKLTNPQLPDSVVEQGVYQTSLENLKSELENGKTSNQFLKWIHDNNATDLKEFLLLAKELEELRAYRVSAWYYPSDKSGFDKASDEKGRLNAILEKCKAHSAGRLADRYALQGVRALMTLGDYQGCVDYYNRTMKRYPDSNLFKRMAQGYIAGCYSRLGDNETADAIFTRLGDFVSISSDKRLEYLAKDNPESEIFKAKLNHYIGYGDSIDNVGYMEIADIALKSPKTVHKADWLYLKAYIEQIYRGNTSKALKYAHQALASSFSDPRMRDDARYFIICLTPYSGNSLADLKWMLERKDIGMWKKIVPGLVEKKELTKALLITNYDTMPDTLKYDWRGRDWHTWANAGFQMLLSCKADDVVRYKNELANPTMALTKMLRPKIRHDSDYLNELIGTLYLREGNYDAAVKYLENVSFQYQISMNIYKEQHLSYNPWDWYYSRDDDPWYYRWYKSYYDDEEEEEPTPGFYEPNFIKSKVSYLSSQVNAKLNFAKEMARLEKEMRTSSDIDKRGMARLKHAMGRYNSLNTCWALTQYWLGSSNQCYYSDYHPYSDYTFDFIISTPRELKGIDEWLESEVTLAFDEMSNPETLAEAHMMLRNYRTVAQYYPLSAAAQILSSHCDAWADWL